LEITALGDALPKQQASRHRGIGPHIVPGPGPFLRSLVERQRGFLLQEIAARDHAELKVPIQRLRSQTLPSELRVPCPRGGDYAQRLNGFSAQCRQLALPQFPNGEWETRVLIHDVPGQGAIDIDPFPPFVGPEFDYLMTASLVLLLTTPLADGDGAA